MIIKNVLLSVLLSFLLAACGTTTPIGAPDAASPAVQPDSTTLLNINACYSGLSSSNLPIWYALEKGMFQKYGLNVNLTFISSGSKATTALITHDVDMCQVAGTGIVNAVAAGQDAVLIASLYNIYPTYLYVTSDIKTPEDLKGKAIGVSQPGSATTTGAILILRELGLDAEKDVTLLDVGEQPDRLAAMQAGQISGALLSSPFNLVAEEKGYVQLYDLANSGVPYQFLGIATRRDYIESNRHLVLAFMKAMVESISALKNDRDGSREILAKYLQYDLVADVESLDDGFDNVILKYLEAIPYPELPGIQTLIDMQALTNPDVLKITPEQTVDTSIMDELEQSGFLNDYKK